MGTTQKVTVVIQISTEQRQSALCWQARQQWPQLFGDMMIQKMLQK